MRAALPVLLAALALCSCYQSKAPLIAARDADFPIAGTPRYAFDEWNESERRWDSSETGSVSREGDHYLQHKDNAGSSAPDPFLVKAIGEGFFIAQEGSDDAYSYDLLRIEGNTVYDYGVACDSDAKKYMARGLIDSVDDAGLAQVCTVSDFGKLAQVFRAIAAEHPQPKGRFVLTP